MFLEISQNSQVFFWEFYEISKNTFFIEHLWWLLPHSEIKPRIVGHAPIYYLSTCKKLLSLPNHSIRVCVKGKRVNREAGQELEIPAEYIFYGNENII